MRRCVNDELLSPDALGTIFSLSQTQTIRPRLASNSSCSYIRVTARCLAAKFARCQFIPSCCCDTGRCGKIYGRHSKSLDIEKKCCGVCRSLLTFLGRFNQDGTPAKVCPAVIRVWSHRQPECLAQSRRWQMHSRWDRWLNAASAVCARSARIAEPGTLQTLSPSCDCAQPRQATGFSAFVKDNFESARKACGGPKTPHRAVMSRLADQWAQHKATAAMGAMQIGA